MKTKLTMLKEYVDKQAYDHGIWFEPTSIVEDYLQQEIRRVAWLIEDATVDQIQAAITEYDARL